MEPNMRFSMNFTFDQIIIISMLRFFELIEILCDSLASDTLLDIISLFICCCGHDGVLFHAVAVIICRHLAKHILDVIF